MSLSTLPRQLEARLPSNLQSVPWTRSLAAGTLLAGVVLLIMGRRKAAVAVAAAGTAVALIEDPESVRKFWNNVPGYVQAGQRALARLEGLVEQVAEQGAKLTDILRGV